MSATVTARAYAKVNLALSVGPPLPASAGAQAGFHPIASWFSAIELWDDLSLRRLDDGETSRYAINSAGDAPRRSPIDWPIEKDLAVRAHRLLEAEVGRPLPLEMRLSKRIPVGGGVGGGSSDAAAMLRGANLLFDLGLSDAKLAHLSTRLGSDVAFFVDGTVEGPPRPAMISGVGDRIERVGRAPGWLVLLLPPVGCPTGPVYRAFDARPDAALQEGRVRALIGAGIAQQRIDTRALFNDLAGPAQGVQPVLAQIRASAEQALETSVHVTGSGSTLFVLADSRESALRLADLATRRSLDAVPVVTRLL
jgi:4-diphosphocytidyl-2-C-methyl-D-erythritol kinase